ncbi:X-Pro dipeptidyl-peptidase (S15) family protein [Renibacterium salmoninarum ATCC 33209]|uniref:X-Pro dipeptidyl-peptidase (S15) family protein n=1 Tax=Renibacterium salmoninarum (strain ATCC 33209 / DSM 20767 / JCM 11484 / NBRC 15589 / NCIMB 2235) TaxID=288705 RepID=A9WUT3_RENSM|nr:X-Pro dipeptidyl-peptidase (S15) family protein [Renibacterium salmoninarum ATCC 33209]
MLSNGPAFKVAVTARLAYSASRTTQSDNGMLRPSSRLTWLPWCRGKVLWTSTVIGPTTVAFSVMASLTAGEPNPRTAIAGNADITKELREHRVRDEYYQERDLDLSQSTVPLLSSGNWRAYGLHLSGNIEGYLAAGSTDKWLEIHEGNHYAPFHSEHGREYQKRFFDRFLAGDETAWQDEPPVRLTISGPDGSFERTEAEWPIARTEWTKSHLDVARGSLDTTPPAETAVTSYPAPAGGSTLFTAPFEHDVEITGPAALYV